MQIALSPFDLLIITTLLALFIGSFLNVCIYRVPITYDLFDEEFYPALKSIQKKFAEEKDKKLSTTFPARSFCPSCEHQLAWYHNIPVLSWLLLGGKCAFCKTAISVRYPLVELTSALAAVISVIFFGFTFSALVTYIIFAAFIVITCIDYDHFMIPDVISFPMMILGLFLITVNQFQPFLEAPFVPTAVDSLIGIAAGAGSLYSIATLYLWLRKREGLGLGDVKLLAVTGIFFGFQGAFFTIFVGSLLGSFFGIAMIAIGKKNAAQEIPFGPYLCVANALYILIASQAGQALVQQYLG